MNVKKSFEIKVEWWVFSSRSQIDIQQHLLVRESVIVAAQNQIIKRNFVKAKDRKVSRSKMGVTEDWNARVQIPVVVGSSGVIHKYFGKRLIETGITAEIGQVQ